MEKERKHQFDNISTGNGYQNDLIATTNNRLEMTVVELRNLQKNNTDQTERLGTLLDELLGDISFLKMDILQLVRTIEEANKKNDKLQRIFLGLTIIGTVFTVLSAIQVIDILVRGIGK